MQRKQRFVRFSARLDAAVFCRIQAQARRRHQTVSKWVRRAVERELEVRTEAELRALVAKISKSSLEDVAVDDDLVAKLDLDSLSGLRLLAAVEKQFAIRFPDHRLSEFRTMRQILDLIRTTETEIQPCASA